MFDPFKKINCRYGAPMGRHGDDPASFPKDARLYARHSGGDGYYDKGGAYWGAPADVYAVWTRGGEFCAYVRASSKGHALRQVMAVSS